MSESPEEVIQTKVTPWRERSAPLFALLFLVGSFVLVFTLLTVNNRRSAELGSNQYSRRANVVIDIWLRHGYFRSGGIMAFNRAKDGTPVFYRAPGSYMVSGFLVEKLHMLLRGRYNWRLLAVHNQVLSLVLSTLIGLLAFRIARRFGIGWLHAFLLGISTEVVVFTFPDNLGVYWEYYAQYFALIFAACFLLIEERALDDEGRGWSWLQIAVAFALAHAEFAFGLFFLVSYAAFHLIVARERVRWKPLLLKTVLPIALFIVVFTLQIAWNFYQFPTIETTGNSFRSEGFLFRTGLDGSDRYYRTHSDIALGRDVARKIFPGHQEYLLRWPWLFACGLASLAALVFAWFRNWAPRFVILALVCLLGGYIAVAAVFSQAVAIHPYLYDIFLATPLILALFGAAPALVESRTGKTGFFILVTLFAALWCAWMQLRLYALRYPLSSEKARPPASAKAPVVSAWKSVPYNAALFTADRGAKWIVEARDVGSLTYSIAGRTMTVAFRIANTSVLGGPPSVLEIAIPEGRRAKGLIGNTVLITDKGELVPTLAQTFPGGRVIQVFRYPTGLWSASVDTTQIVGQVSFDVE